MGNEIRFSLINLYPCVPGFRTSVRILDCHYLFYVHSGVGKYKIGSNTYDAKMGDFFYCPPGVGNAIYADEKDPFVHSGIMFDVIGPGGEVWKLPDKLNISGDPFLLTCIREMIKEYRFGKNEALRICARILEVVIARCVRLSSMPDREDITQQLLEYIVANFNKPLTHEALSRLFSYHKNSINRLLIQATGMSLKNYLIDLRIKKASEYLRCSSKTVAEIAELCGYSGSNFFSRQFREKTGFSPLAYRRMPAAKKSPPL